jgi:sugar lactone lactonase YvrE
VLYGTLSGGVLRQFRSQHSTIWITTGSDGRPWLAVGGKNAGAVERIAADGRIDESISLPRGYWPLGVVASTDRLLVVAAVKERVRMYGHNEFLYPTGRASLVIIATS